MKLIFLDYDGVLHPAEVYRNPRSGKLFLDQSLAREGHTLFEHAHLLERLLDESGVDIEIVLSTSWVRVLRNFNRAKKFLPVGLQRRVVGATWHSRMSMSDALSEEVSQLSSQNFTSMTRCEQIIAHCVRNRIADSDWIAIDDDAHLWHEHLLGNLVRTDEVLGIGKSSTQQELLRKLRAEW